MSPGIIASINGLHDNIEATGIENAHRQSHLPRDRDHLVYLKNSGKLEGAQRIGGHVDSELADLTTTAGRSSF
jgi:hypothetical protein